MVPLLLAVACLELRRLEAVLVVGPREARPGPSRSPVLTAVLSLQQAWACGYWSGGQGVWKPVSWRRTRPWLPLEGAASSSSPSRGMSSIVTSKGSARQEERRVSLPLEGFKNTVDRCTCARSRWRWFMRALAGRRMRVKQSVDVEIGQTARWSRVGVS